VSGAFFVEKFFPAHAVSILQHLQGVLCGYVSGKSKGEISWKRNANFPRDFP
jgi:hypothetical protein